jgi:hypothetical protein
MTEMLANSSSIHEVLTELAKDAESPDASSEASASSIAVAPIPTGYVVFTLHSKADSSA